MTTAVSNLQAADWLWRLVSGYFTTAPGLIAGYAMIYTVSLVIVTWAAIRND